MCSFRNASHASYLLATSSRYLRRYRVSRTWEMLSNEAAKMINQLTPDISSNDFEKMLFLFQWRTMQDFFFILFPAINATQHSYFVILYIETVSNCFNTFNQSTKHILTSSKSLISFKTWTLGILKTHKRSLDFYLNNYLSQFQILWSFYFHVQKQLLSSNSFRYWIKKMTNFSGFFHIFK